MPVTNEDIMEKLNRIESLLTKVESEEEKIESEESTELSELKDSSIMQEFPNIEDWRKYVWEGCEFKEEKSEGSEVDFWCKKQNSPCRFEGCPLNVKG